MTNEVSKEIDWLIQSCWNQAIDSQSQSLESNSCTLFEYCAELIAAKNSSEYLDYIRICYYYSIKFRIKAARSDKTRTEEHLQIARKSHQSLSLLIITLKEKLPEKEIKDLESYLFLTNFETEIISENWENVAQTLDSTDLTAFSIPLLKCMAGKNLQINLQIKLR